VQIDISKTEEIYSLIQRFGKTYPSLKGIVHAAGVLDEGTLLSQNWNRFEKIFAPKVLGAWNLYNALQKEKISLDFFVMFSSIAATLGLAGLSSYAAANTFLDALAYYCHQQNMPALSINWGPWAEVGMGVPMVEPFALSGIIAIKPEQGLQALEKALKTEIPQLMIAAMNWQRYSQKLTIHPQWLTELIIERKTTIPTLSLIAQLQAVASDERHRVLHKAIHTLVAQLLEIDPQTLDDHKGFFNIGMKSLVAVELKNQLQIKLEDKLQLSATLAFEYPTVEKLTNYIFKIIQPLIEPTAPTPKEAEPIKAEVPSKAEAEIMGLSKEEILRQLEESLKSKKDK
jgi:short-subunit dehydrogenase/acyl carrier protein